MVALLPVVCANVLVALQPPLFAVASNEILFVVAGAKLSATAPAAPDEPELADSETGESTSVLILGSVIAPAVPLA